MGNAMNVLQSNIKSTAMKGQSIHYLEGINKENMTGWLGVDDESDDDENDEDILTTPRHGLPDEFIVKDGNEELTKDGNEVDDIINPGDDIDDDVIIEDDD